MSPKPPTPPKGPKKCMECGHHHCICKSKECSDYGEKDCSCKQEVNVVINFNFATGGTGSAGGVLPDINFDFESGKLTVNDQEINLSSGSKKDKKKDHEE